MSDLDENLTSILSSLIDTDGIEAPNATVLPDNATFNDGRLDFDNLANCITGNDASLHQSSDENVSSLLETHLEDLSQTENIIVEAANQNLDDVAQYDLDKPIESLLESGSSEFISQECTETQNSIVDKVTDVQNETQNVEIFESTTLELDENVVNTKLSEIESVPQLNDDAGNLSAANEEIVFNTIEENDNEPLATLTSDAGEIETNSPVQETVESYSDLENPVAGSDVEGDEELGETIIADEIPEEGLTKVTSSKHEGKKRRRILVCDDGDSNSELDEERERLLQSKSPTPPDTGDGSQSDEYVNKSDGDNCEDDDDYIRDPNERPGPKSKKKSTHLYNALKVKALLESAIVIPARKKKKRVIDSDDEYNESVLNQPIASVDDIGLIPEDNIIQQPFNVPIEIEPKDSTEIVKKELDVEMKPVVSSITVKTEIIYNSVIEKEPAFIKVEPMTRNAQIKMEKYTNNNRRSHKKKESKDYFGLPLNAPYVDTSSDEDYFLPQDSSGRRHQQHHTQQRGNKYNSSSGHSRRKKGHIPDDIYFNAKVPLHVLYSYDDSSSDDGKNVTRNTHSVPSHKSSIQPTNRTLNKMPPVHKIIPKQGKTFAHKIVPKQPSRPTREVKPPAKLTVFEQLDKLKRLLKASGIKVNINDLLKGSKTFQERCERIRDLLYRNGIEGEPTLAKCKKLRKQVKLKEEIAGLDPSAIIESKEEDGRPKRSTRRATRRNYVFGEPESDVPEKKEDASQLLQKIKEFIDSDSDYEADDQNQTSNSIDPSKMVETTLNANDLNETQLAIDETNQPQPHPVETPVDISIPDNEQYEAPNLEQL